jgi:predicted nuclease with TOPRIM domain
MNSILLRYLAFFGPDKPPADLSFAPGLNVICGASETGKSFIVETIDFMLGQEKPVRDIPERDGYDRVRLTIESSVRPPLTLDRSVEGGNFRGYDEILTDGMPQTKERTLRWKHSALRQDTLSYALLERTGLTPKVLRTNAAGKTRSLSFRDMARLCVVTEEEIQGRSSPLLSGQYTTATGEYAAFKLLLTGADDSALVAAKDVSGRSEQDAGKIELLDQMIADFQTELDEEGAEEEELKDQLTRLDKSIRTQNDALAAVQRALDSVLQRRGTAAGEVRNRRARISEIDELVERFGLLDSHYQTDLDRLAAIYESGSMFVHLEQQPCPLCGALPGDQHLDLECEGNTETVVKAADAEIVKIKRLRRELSYTVTSLTTERNSLLESLAQFDQEYKACELELSEIASPVVSTERTSYNKLVSERAEVRFKLEKIDRLKSLTAQRTELAAEQTETAGNTPGTRTQISKNVLDEFAQKIEGILKEWHFPNANRVFFDEAKRDFQIAGKERGSTGKGLRAITHAAVKIGLMEFCRERDLPHPGFVILDSPLLAYWKPEGDDDDLRGTDLKEMFYRYLLGLRLDSQVIIIENEHPPEFVSLEGNVIVFTKNSSQGRYGFFPAADSS